MKQTITLGKFRDAFHHAGRGSQFTYEALEVLFNYLEDCDEDYDLDVIGLCCEYAESSIQEIIDSYSFDVDGIEEDDLGDSVELYLQENTSVCGAVAGGFVYAQF